MKIFDPDGFFMEILGKLSDLILLNFTFVIFSLPIFTIGASLSALYECTFSLLDDTEDRFVPRQFFRAFKRNFKRGTGAWLLALIPILFLLAYSRVIGYFDGPLGKIYRVSWFLFVIIFAIGFQYIFPMIAKTNMKVKEIWKQSWLLAIVALPWSIANLVVMIGLSLVFTLLLPTNTAVYLWGFLFFALIVFFSSMIIERVFNKFSSQE